MQLEVAGLRVRYGAQEAVSGIDLRVGAGEVVALLGANGAGKTTTLRSISGIAPPRIGTIVFQGREIQELAGHEVAALGIAHSPEGRRIFPRMTVMENLEMGAYLRADRRTGAVDQDVQRVFELFLRLQERRRQPGGTLSGGEQQMLAIGRALMARPKLLLLDEPSMGLAPKLVTQIFDIVSEINAQGTTVLLVEQNAAQALQRATRAYVMEAGSIVRSADAAALLDDESVRAAYLGGSVT